MRRISILGLCCLLLLGGFGSHAAAEFKRIKIAVLDFQLQGQGFETEDMGAIVAEWCITAMVKDGRFDVIERGLLKKILEEQRLNMSGVVDESTAVTVGKLLGVKAIITGTVMKLSNVLEINSRIIDVESASIIAAENVQSTRVSALQPLVVQMSKKIIKNFPLQGYIVSRHEKQVAIDLGRLSGIKPGMVFVVYKEGRIIKHPKTGKVLDVEQIKTGEIVVTEVHSKITDCEIRSETEPDAVAYGQMVKSRVLPSTNAPGRLFVDTQPPGARVRILNIGPAYHRGIRLGAGRYHLEASAAGYLTDRRWIDLLPGEEKVVDFVLTQLSGTQAVVPQTGSSSTPKPVTAPSGGIPAQARKYIAMLQSENTSTKRKGAKYIARKYGRHPKVLQVVENTLLQEYRHSHEVKGHLDALAWMCKVLRKSGQVQRYRNTLNTVANYGDASKLKRHCSVD